MAFVIKIAGKSLLFAADSDNVQPELYQHVEKIVGNIDIVFLGME